MSIEINYSVKGIKLNWKVLCVFLVVYLSLYCKVTCKQQIGLNSSPVMLSNLFSIFPFHVVILSLLSN